MKILILGGTGYIGKIVQDLLLKKNYQVYSLGTKTCPSFKIGEKNNLDIINEIDFVFYFAWYFNTNDKNYFSKNINSLVEVLKVCKKKDIPLIFLSTLFASRFSQSLYNRAKAECEILVNSYNQRFIRFGAVLVEGYKLEGFYGKISNFVSKYRIFPVIYPNKKIFFTTSINELNLLINNFTNKEFVKINLINPFPQFLSELINVNKKFYFKFPIYWRILYFFVKLFEIFKIPLNFRSDSFLAIWGKNEYN